ncbi:MAG: Trk system potassium transporter TrkA [Gammaproteobacteria bacterium]|jgi:trk system potassium uptake protein TrkA|nr:MAG: Trk system potassium transporter TrkA [Gammaproteobacteria bacterium]
MNILILGAGQVGSSAAYDLSQSEANEVTVVDFDGDRLRELQDRLDIRTVQGHAAHPQVLTQAGGADADIVIALTDSDEVNMLACQVAFTLFRTPTKIARIRSIEYTSTTRLFSPEAIPVDEIISPEQLVTEYIEQLIHYPGALQVLNFADGKVRLAGVVAHRGGLLVGQELRQLRRHIPHTDARVAAIYRRRADGTRDSILPEGDTVLRENDIVFFIAARKDIRVMMSELRKLEHPIRRVIIAGGGNIGYQLAKRLETTNQVKLLERDKVRARYIAERLSKTIVLPADATDEELLAEENIENTDVFCAVTNAEEANILSSLLAKRMGAKKVIALVNRPSYTDIIERQNIDIAVSPQQITLGSLLTKVRRGDVVQVHSLRQGSAEALETIAHGTPETSDVVGRTIEDINLPPGATIAALVREGDVIMAHHDEEIQPEDHVIVFLTETDEKYIRAVEKLFQPSPTLL